MPLLKKNRLSTKDFIKNKARVGGFWHKTSILGVKSLKNTLLDNRFGLVVGSNISKNAVTRNLIKRRLRDIVSKNASNLKKGFDIVIITYPSVKDVGYKDLEAELLEIFKNLRLLISA